MEICFVAANYPTQHRQVHIFLRNVVEKLVDSGEKCTVIAPQSYVAYWWKKGVRRPVEAEYVTPAGNRYMVYSPLYAVFPKKRWGELSLLDVQRWSFYRALHRAYRQHGLHADVMYSHFVQMGIAGVRLAREEGIASVIANGEADTVAECSLNSRRVIRRTLRDVTGILSVSSANREELRELSGNDASLLEKVEVIVNGADTDRFCAMDRLEAREKLGWPQDAFVAAFTGSFIHRKGVLRVAEAVDRLEDVYGVFMGVGEQQPQCRNMLHCGRVANTEMAQYLSAADVFVLPTLAEGCCNAIVEALLCGLPVISSDRPFNRDILDESCALLIEPEDVDAITRAIAQLRDDPVLREKLAQGAAQRRQMLSLDARVERIRRFLAQQIEKKSKQVKA